MNNIAIHKSIARKKGSEITKKTIKNESKHFCNGNKRQGKYRERNEQEKIETIGNPLAIKKLQNLYKKFTESRNNMAAKQPKLARARAAKIN